MYEWILKTLDIKKIVELNSSLHIFFLNIDFFPSFYLQRTEMRLIWKQEFDIVNFVIFVLPRIVVAIY